MWYLCHATCHERRIVHIYGRRSKRAGSETAPSNNRIYKGYSRGGKSKVQADDIFHDVLFTFLDRRIKIPASKVQAYLYRMVKNKCLNMVTRPNIESSSISIDNITASAWETLASLDFTAQIPEVEEDTMPEINEIIAYSGQLPERTRDIFYMSRIEGMTHKQIADELGISTRAVEKHLQNSINEYRRHFGFNKRSNTKLS